MTVRSIGINSKNEYRHLLGQLERECNVSKDFYSSLLNLIDRTGQLIESSDEQDRFSKPMPWIGLYIALASLLCIFPMVADLIHGIRNRKLWFPCKYFTINAASLTVIAVAMKLPMDLNNPMPGAVDQGAKLGSMAFMCTIMANLLPSLATMDNKEVLSNVIAFVILVITLVVNVCIQVKTGVVSQWAYSSYAGYNTWVISMVYVALLLGLLVIHICTALTILKSKQILQSKYQAGHETALKDLMLLQSGRLSIVENLKKHVRNYGIMAGTSSPQFTIACSATTSASGVICATSTILLVIFMLLTHEDLILNSSEYGFDFVSDYKWSMLVILVIQFIGVIVGTIAPLARCFAALSFKLSIKWIWNHIDVFNVESYWTQKLCDWKQSSIPFSISSRKSKIIFQFFKILSLNFCIRFQKIVVVACKMIGLVPIILVIFVLLCRRCFKSSKPKVSDLGTMLDNMPSQHDTSINLSINLSRYVLQHQDDMELAERTLENILNSVNNLIKKAESQQPSNLIKLLEGSSGFEGVELFDNLHVPPFLSEKSLNCWSLPVVTLTSIAISLTDIQNNRVNSLVRSVSEGLAYVTLVEESLNTNDEYASIQKAAKLLWLEVEVNHKWLGNKLKNPDPQVNRAGQILQWLKNTAIRIASEVKSRNTDELIDESICANSMYRITETILLSYNTNIEQVSQEELYLKLSSMITDILAACLTNLPQVIVMKCHESVIEKRESSVEAAAQLLGETTQIIKSLHDRELPSLHPDELMYIDKWRAYLKYPFP